MGIRVSLRPLGAAELHGPKGMGTSEVELLLLLFSC